MSLGLKRTTLETLEYPLLSKYPLSIVIRRSSSFARL